MPPAAIKKKRFSINTLRAHLAIMLMAAFTLISFLAALNGYLSRMKEAEKLMDNQLHHASEVLMLNNQATSQAVIAIQYGDDFSFQMWRNNHLLLRSALAPETPINDFQDGFAAALDELDEIYLLDIYPARELPMKGVTSEIIFNKMKNPNKHLVQKSNLLNELQLNGVEVLMTLGAGDIDRLVKPIKALISTMNE